MHACMHAQLLSHVPLFATLWTVAHQAPLSWDFSAKNTRWVATSSSRGLPDPGIKPWTLALQEYSLTADPSGGSCRIYRQCIIGCISFPLELDMEKAMAPHSSTLA